MKARALLAAAMAIAGACALWTFAPGTTPQGPAVPLAPGPQAMAPPAAPFVPSMTGTRPDGRLAAPGGQLRIDAELRHLFDYYLSALGEADLPAIRAGIEQELARRLKPAAAAEAGRLLGQYLSYKRALAEAEGGLAAPADNALAKAARNRLQAMHALRKRYFTAAEAEGLFADTDARDLDAIARLELADDKSLAPAQLHQRIDELDRRLPPGLQEERAAPQRVLKLEEQVQAARSGGAGEDDIFRLRAAALDPAAAGRLAQLDREQAEWLRKVSAYRTESNRLAGDRAAIQRLRDSIFTSNEQKRLGAYE